MSILTPRPLISILMPCKNANLYLEECLLSIVEQTYLDWELIIVDDHSSDHSMRTLEKWSNRYPNIIICSNEGSGIINSLRLAYKISKGSFITRMDADDIMTPNKLNIMVSQLESSGPNHIATGKVKYFRRDQPLGKGYIKYADWLNSLSIAGSNFEEIYKECVIPSPCWMMYNKDFERIGAFESDVYPEDYDLVFRMYKHQLKVIPSDVQILHLWRDHSDRASRNDDNYRDNRFLELKVSNFIELDYDDICPLVLWGAGAKAKTIAKYLVKSKVNFHWITDNKNKIGHNIYGTVLYASTHLSTLAKAQVILTVANPHEQIEIKEKIELLDNNSDYQSFWFC